MNSYFTCGARRGQFNLGNTVLVNLTSLDEFLLGYLQDINGDQVFIDFDCERIAPRWVPLQHVWHYEKPRITFDLPCNVYAAVRREVGGPYVVQTAKLLCNWSYDNQFLCCVAEHVSCSTEKYQAHIVHHWQLIERLPRNRHIDGICRIPIKKVVYRSAKLRLLNDVQEFHIERLLDVGFRQGHRQIVMDRDSAFARIREEEIVFVIMRIQCCYPRVMCPLSRKCGHNTCWLTDTEKKVAAGIENYLFQTTGLTEHLGNVGYRPQPDIAVLSSLALKEQNKFGLSNLPPEIMSTVTYYLDTVSQGKLKRVCELWNTLLSDPTSSDYITIDFCALSPLLQRRAETEGYRLGRLLHRIISTRTKTLALVNMNYRADTVDPVIALITDILTMKRRIPLIIIKNCWANILKPKYGPGVCYYMYTPDIFEWRKIHFQLLLLKKVCHRLQMFNVVINCGAWKGVLFPRQPGNYGRLKQPDSLIITIPKLEFDESASDADSIMQLKQALERHCPPVNPSVRNQIRRLHAGWVQRYRCPSDQWDGLRQLIELFGIGVAADHATQWCYGGLDCDVARNHALYFCDLDLTDFEGLPMGTIILNILARAHIPSFRCQSKTFLLPF
ncbi:uncharacterized protein LOC129580679 [Paramacrobiotus metropolitanus]|uniref:uncharacterized protein LOC129580679 n=1 Tax=Paramacrobiotus metropolitanus TaxID=2943436 RepID=UPI0024464876|nr:uncharacterized protein LOC129580679 [Paramacrobiotus metropolitanus]